MRLISGTVLLLTATSVAGAQSVDSLPAPFGELAKFGLLGVILAIIFKMYYGRDADLRASWEARLQVTQQVTQVIEANNAALQAATVAQHERNRATEAAARAQEATARAVENLARETQTLNRTVEQLIHDLEDVRRGGRT